MLTLREPFAPGLWAEAGAMRIPRSHRLTMALIDRFGLATQPFTMDNARRVLLLRRPAVSATASSPATRARSGFEVRRARARPAVAALEQRARAVRAQLRDQGDDAWDEIAAEYDQYAVREFLELREWSEGAIEMFGLLFNQEALMNSSFLELLREELGDFYTDLVYLDGGTDHAATRVPPRARRRGSASAPRWSRSTSPTTT